MKFRKLFFRTLLAILIFNAFGCSNREKFIEDEYYEIEITNQDFGKKIFLQGKPVDLINDHLLNPKFIHLSDSILISLESDISKGFFKSFSLADYSFLGSYGVRGEGPEEFSNVLSNVAQVYNHRKDNSISIYDWGRKKLLDLDLVSLAKDDYSFNKRKDYVVPPELLLAQRVTFLNDTTVIAADGIDEGILAFVNIESDSVSYIPFDLYKKRIDLSPRDKRKLNRAVYAVNKPRNRIVTAMLQYPKIILFDMEGDLIKEINFPLQKNPATKSEIDRKLFYRDVKVTDAYIYAVYLGLTSQETENIYNNYLNKNSSFSTEVHVFNWEGEPVRKLLLENKFIPFIQVDGINNRIFAIDVFSDYKSVLSFESELIK